MIKKILELARATNQQKRGIYELQRQEEAERKLFSRDEAKPGELVEILEVLEGERWEVADELADIMYYAVQIGCSDKFVPLAEALGFTHREAFLLAVVKYTRRVRSASKDKPAEQERVRRFVATLMHRQVQVRRARSLICELLAD